MRYWDLEYLLFIYYTHCSFSTFYRPLLVSMLYLFSGQSLPKSLFYFILLTFFAIHLRSIFWQFIQILFYYFEGSNHLGFIWFLAFRLDQFLIFLESTKLHQDQNSLRKIWVFLFSLKYPLAFDLQMVLYLRSFQKIISQVPIHQFYDYKVSAGSFQVTYTQLFHIKSS